MTYLTWRGCFTVALGFLAFGAAAQESPVRFQLNWLHDPTFVAAYHVQNENPKSIRIFEGGPNIFPLGKLRTGEAQVAIVGLDILLRAANEDLGERRPVPFRILGIDFQRTPVAYVMHP